MICPECGTKDTRRIQSELYADETARYRRYECGNAHRFTTFEVHETVLHSYGSRWLKVARQRLAITDCP